MVDYNERGAIITNDSKEDILNQFDFSHLSLSENPTSAQTPVFVKEYLGIDRRKSFRRQTVSDRRKVARFVGMERRVAYRRSVDL